MKKNVLASFLFVSPFFVGYLFRWQVVVSAVTKWRYVRVDGGRWTIDGWIEAWLGKMRLSSNWHEFVFEWARVCLFLKF